MTQPPCPAPAGQGSSGSPRHQTCGLNLGGEVQRNPVGLPSSLVEMGKRPTASLPACSVGNLEQGALEAAAVSHLSPFTAVPPTLASEYGEGYGFVLLTGSQGLRHPP